MRKKRVILVVILLLLSLNSIPSSTAASTNYQRSGNQEQMLNNELKKYVQNSQINSFPERNPSNQNNFTLINSWCETYFREMKHLIINRTCAIFIDQFNDVIFLNISNSYLPEYITKIELTSEIAISKLVLENNRLYLWLDFPYNYNSITIYDINDLTNITKIGHYEQYTMIDFIVEETTIFLLTRKAIVALNTTNPANITLFSNYYIEKIQYDSQIVVCNGVVFFYDYLRLLQITFQNPEEPQLVTDTLLMIPNYVYVNEQFLVLLNHTKLMILEFSGDSIPTLITTFTGRCEYIQKAAIYNSHLYLYSRFNPRILIFSLVDRENITIVSNIFETYPDHCIDFSFHNDVLYLWDFYNEIYLYNVSDPTNLLFIHSICQVAYNSFTMHNDYVFLSHSYPRIDILNVSTPHEIQRVATFIGNETIKDLVISDSIAVAGTVQGIQVINFTNIENPTILATFEVGVVSTLEIVEEYVIAAGVNLTILDISSLANITVASNNKLRSSAVNMAVEDAIAIFTYGADGYDIYNISNILDPEYLGFTDYPGGYCYDVTIQDKIAYFAYGYLGWIIVNVTTITDPELILQIGQNWYSDSAQTVFVDNDLLFLSSSRQLCKVYNISSLEDYSYYGELNIELPIAWGYQEIVKADDNYYCFSVSNGFQTIGLDGDNDYLADSQELIYFSTNPYDNDTDKDSMLDGFEVRYRLDPTNSSDAFIDLDGDNLTNQQEFENKSNPWKSDTDMDHLIDGTEVHIYGTSPILYDTDADKLVDYYEVKIILTNPLLTDSDEDGLSDYDELFEYSTNPNYADTDTDLMDDFYEIEYGLNPLDETDANFDLDLDGLTNIEEYLLGTKPNNCDTDADGFTDKEERDAGTDPIDPNDFPKTTNTQSVTKGTVATLIIYYFLIPSCGFLLVVVIAIVQRKRRARV